MLSIDESWVRGASHLEEEREGRPRRRRRAVRLDGQLEREAEDRLLIRATNIRGLRHGGRDAVRKQPPAGRRERIVGDEEGRRVDSDEGGGVGSFYPLSSKLCYYGVRGC